MKEYKVQYKEVNANTWWDLGCYSYSLEDAKKVIEVQKSYDKNFFKNWEYCEDWEYRILVRNVSEWETYERI